MKIMRINGGKNLSGSITIGGAKNSAVALVPACILTDEAVINNIPNISDVRALEEIMNYLGAEYYKEGNKVTINSKKVKNKDITLEYSQKLRASYYFMGALLGKFKKVSMYFPGGCNIGERPINFHLSAFEKLGAKVDVIGNKYVISAKKLVGTDISFPFPSVGATINTLFASVKASGVTTINNAATEPEVGNIIDFLISMGAKIEGKNTSKLIITGVSRLSKGNIDVIPDRIEAGTYMLLGAMLGDNLTIKNVKFDNLDSLINIFDKIGVDYKIKDNSITINKSKIKPIDVETGVYPGFPTDLQQPLTSLLCLSSGTSHIKETIYENRFQNVKYLNELGANIKINNDTITIKGNTIFHNGNVSATDLRAGASLILACLMADGESTIDNIEHVLRGYDGITSKLSKVHADIKLDYV